MTIYENVYQRVHIFGTFFSLAPQHYVSRLRMCILGACRGGNLHTKRAIRTYSVQDALQLPCYFTYFLRLPRESIFNIEVGTHDFNVNGLA